MDCINTSILVNSEGVYCSDLDRNLKKVFKAPRYVEKVETLTAESKQKAACHSLLYINVSSYFFIYSSAGFFLMCFN